MSKNIGKKGRPQKPAKNKATQEVSFVPSTLAKNKPAETKRDFSLLSVKFFAALVLAFIFGLIVALTGIANRIVAAQEVVPAPVFPLCENKIFSSIGDHAHYSSGLHGIPGVGNLSGRDDVYTLSGGNFLQCFCPTGDASISTATGIQSNWWDVKSLTSSQINDLKAQGWFYQTSGIGWNLLDDPYLVKNREFSCIQPTPTPTAVPTVTVAPTPTPTKGPNNESKCYQLEAQPAEGTAPLTVKFIGHADDPSQHGVMKAWKFDFSDTSGGQQQVVEQTGDKNVAYHRYENAGKYRVVLVVQDQAGNWRGGDDCVKEINVHGQPQILGSAASTELPSTGPDDRSLALFLGLIPGGLYLYRRFKLV